MREGEEYTTRCRGYIRAALHVNAHRLTPSPRKERNEVHRYRGFSLDFSFREKRMAYVMSVIYSDYSDYRAEKRKKRIILRECQSSCMKKIGEPVL